MTEVKKQAAALKKRTGTRDLTRLIQHDVLQLFQIYLDNAEEGHYATAKLVNARTIVVDNVSNQQVGHFTASRSGLATDFTQNSLLLRIKMETAADRIAARDS